MKTNYSIALAFAVILIGSSCKKEKENNIAIPACVQAVIDSSLARPAGSLFIQVDAYKYQGKTVYLYYSGCCDRNNLLYDSNCNYLFSPSGGITGMGDLSHPNFYNEAVKLSTLWKDPRN